MRTRHNAASGTSPRRIWIDLANSPHPILFEPIVDELRDKGHEVLITARDHAQTLALAQERWPDVHVIGGRSPGGRSRKAAAVAGRARALACFARRNGMDVAVSHNSYAQTVAARLGRIPCVTAMDYEFQPANHVAFRLADRVLVPDDFPAARLRSAGGTSAKVWRYSGFKEEVYLHDFRPDPGVLNELGLQHGSPFFVARPSPQGATYHQFGNPLFDQALAQVLARGDARVVLLPRRREDVIPIAGVAPKRCIVPDRPVDSRSLLYYATALIGAGGTMNREAALLGTPVFTLYAGKPAALDQRLIREGRLSTVTDVATFEARLADLAAGRERIPAPTLTRHVLDRFLEAILSPLSRGTDSAGARADLGSATRSA
jgi:predicted glycosyltransferase